MNKKISEKIKKLFKQAESEAQLGNKEAANNFALHAQKLLIKYNLTRSEIEREAERAEGLDYEPVTLIISPKEDWQNSLLSAVAAANGCVGLYDLEGLQMVAGRADDRALTIELYLYFEKLAFDLAEAASSFYRKHSVDVFWVTGDELSERVKNFRRSFLTGFVVSVNTRFIRAKMEAENEAADEQEQTALVWLGDKLAQSETFAKELFNYREHQADVPDLHEQAFRQGINAGGKVALTNKTLK